MAKILVTSTLGPFIDGEAREKGFVGEVSEELKDHLVQHDLAIELAEGSIPVIAPKGKAKADA
jgi:hypothetical protein